MTGGTQLKDVFLAQMGGEWQRFLDTAQGIPEDHLFTPSAVGHWSLRDAIIHVSDWDEEQARLMEQHRTSGEETSYGDDKAVDRLNQTQVDGKRDMSMNQIWDTLDADHARLLRRLNSLPEDAFAYGTYTGDHIAAETLKHYREHRKDSERWSGSEG
jgi:hypothetical protein